MFDSSPGSKPYFVKKEARKKAAFWKRLKKQSKSIGVWVIAILTAIFALGGLFGFRPVGQKSISPDQVIADYVETYPDQGRAHIPVGASHPDYNSNPPTSGWHYAEPAPWGIYDHELADGALIHNLEHCGIWISYQPGIAPADIQTLVNFARGFPTKVILAPRSGNPAPIVLAAWRRLMKLAAPDETKMTAFVTAFLGKAGPECQAP